MSSKIQYKIDNTIKNALQAFDDFKAGSLENSLNNARKACEAMCRAIILNEKGDIDGEKIILGELKSNLRANSRNSGGGYNIPLLASLLDICKSKIANSVYYRFQDIRFGGNNASHDSISINSEITENDVNLCLPQLKEILKWFWADYLRRPIPQEIKDAFEGKIEESFLSNNNNSEWDGFYNSCNFFSNEQKFILVAPPASNAITENQIAILGRIDWHFIFDFDSKSQESGLYHAIKSHVVNKEIKPITIEQNNPREKNLVSSSNFAINWFFANGISSNESTISSTEKQWRIDLKYATFIEKLMTEYFGSKVQNVSIIFLWNDIPYIRTIIEKIADIANPSLIKYIIAYDDTNKYPRLEEEFTQYGATFFNLSLSQIIKGISNTVTTRINEIDKRAFQIPARGENENDVYKDISVERLYFEEKSIEIIYNGIENQNEFTQEENSFYKGGIVSWKELNNEIDVSRTKTEELRDKIKRQLEMSKGAYVVDLMHKAGSGGTTLARNTAFYFHKKYPTVIISNYQRFKTSQAIFKLAEISQKPILVIMEAFQVSLNDRDALVREVNIDKKHIVILYVRRYFGALIGKSENPKLIALSDNMVDLSERSRFITKYSLSCPDNSLYINNLENKPLNQCEVIDFSLGAFEKDFSNKTIEDYLLAYLNKLPANELQFIGFACLIHYYTQQSISEYWLTNLFTSRSLSNELLSKPYDERYIKKLLIQEFDTEGESTGFWRPRFNRFGKEILKLVLVGLNKDNKENWKDFLSQWSVNFIKECKDGNQFLTEDLRNIYKNLFLNRNYEDVLGQNEEFEDPNTSGKKFSQIIQHIANKVGEVEIFKTLVDCYKDEAHFYGHLGRFLYETATNPKDFEDAEIEIENAIELGEKDYNLWHLKGMCNRRTVEYLIRESEKFSKEEEFEVERLIQELTVVAQEDFSKSREYNPYNLHSHTAEIQLLIKVINFGKQLSSSIKTADFLIGKENIWYEKKLNDVLNLLDEAQYIIELSKDVEQSKVVAKSKSMIDTCEGNFFGVLGDFTKAIDKFKILSESAERSLRPYFGKMYIYSTLASKVGNNPKKIKEGWAKLSAFEFETLRKTIERSIREQPENPKNFKMWMQALRNSNTINSIESILSTIKTWYDNSINFEIAHLEATYYRYVLHACKAINEGESFGDFDVTEAKKYLDECKQKSTNDKYSFEWYGSGSGIKKMVHHSDLGSMKSEKGFFDDVSKLAEVEGIITNIFDRQQGRIKLACGLEAFFVPARGGFEKGKDEGVTKVKFYIGFRYNGVTAWEVKRLDNMKPIYNESEIVEIEDFDTDVYDNLDENSGEILKEEKIIETYNREAPKLKGITLIDTIDITQFEKYKKKNN
jgi:hypothetical protein